MTARVDPLVVLDMLSRARATIATKGWTQGSPARDASNRFVFESDARAVKFSALGALMLAAQALGVGWVDATTARAVRAMQVPTIPSSARSSSRASPPRSRTSRSRCRAARGL